MENLIKAVHAVMEECKGVDKSLTVGDGRSSYKGVSDKDVKLLIGGSMRKHGLVIFPVKIEPKVQQDRWETVDYNGRPTTKQSIFTEVLVTYRLMHSSGESIEIVGYGHGIDTQDKSAGKATTYALKYTLLYTFLVATGHIDDTDAVHSDAIPTPTPAATVETPAAQKQITDAQFAAMLKYIQQGKIETVKKSLPKYSLTESQQQQINALINGNATN
jgi:hypothetical protein